MLVYPALHHTWLLVVEHLLRKEAAGKERLDGGTVLAACRAPGSQTPRNRFIFFSQAQKSLTLQIQEFLQRGWRDAAISRDKEAAVLRCLSGLPVALSADVPELEVAGSDIARTQPSQDHGRGPPHGERELSWHRAG